MPRQLILFLILLTVLLQTACVPSTAAPTLAVTAMPTATPTSIPVEPLRAGLRASQYGIKPWPSPDWWVNSMGSMASRFADATGSIILILVETNAEAGCLASFPKPELDYEPENMVFNGVGYEAELTAFDERGYKVWLQVEPGSCDVPMLIDVVMTAYGHHPSVIGFGVDVEWYGGSSNPEGNPVSDAEARAWVEKARSFDPAYQVFLKHWLPEKLPPTEREGLVFIDDSQQLASLEAMVDEFAVWGRHFEPAPVGFQFGYESDQRWWGEYDDPAGTLGNAILEAVPNTADLYWVDFTAYQLWPAE